jgi:hypothetical protein
MEFVNSEKKVVIVTVSIHFVATLIFMLYVSNGIFLGRLAEPRAKLFLGVLPKCIYFFVVVRSFSLEFALQSQ